MSNSHLAYSTIDGQQVEGYTVHVTHASAERVEGELLRQSRTALGFIIRADERQFAVPAAITDIRRDFAEYIRQNALSPGSSRLTLLY